MNIKQASYEAGQMQFLEQLGLEHLFEKIAAGLSWQGAKNVLNKVRGAGVSGAVPPPSPMVTKNFPVDPNLRTRLVAQRGAGLPPPSPSVLGGAR